MRMDDTLMSHARCIDLYVDLQGGCERSIHVRPQGLHCGASLLLSSTPKKLNGPSTKAMGAMQFEYGCKGTKHFFTPTGKAAEAFGGKTYVLHLVSILPPHVEHALIRA